MPEESKFHDPESIQMTQIVPPIFPDTVAIRVAGGFGHLLFVTIPDVSKPNNILVVADIVSTPAFLLSVAEHCLAAVRLVIPDAKIDDARVDKYRSDLEQLIIEPHKTEEGKNDSST